MTAPRRAMAWLTCLSFGSALIVAELHRATAVHGFCTHDGELIHLSSAPGDPAATHSGKPLVRTDERVAGSHGCELLAFLVVVATAAQAQACCSCDEAQPGPASRPAEVQSAPIPVLHRAPKLSPPAV